MKIGEAAQRSGVSAKAIRYYESVGLMPAPARQSNAYRDYALADLERLRFIHRARRLGFAVPEVAELLALWQDRERASATVKTLALAHIATIEARMADLAAMKQVLQTLAGRCHGDERPECPILATLAGDEAFPADPAAQPVVEVRGALE